jgi:alkaline phosphatase
VIFGGGECQFVSDAKTSVYSKACRDDHKNLKQNLKQNGYDIVYNTQDLLKTKNNKVIGLFATSELPFVRDRSQDIPNLLTQTQQAVRLLENSPEGFVLVVEGGRIDHAAHSNDPASMVQELIEFDSVIGWAKNYVDSHPNVSIVATADHETGGLTLGHNAVYDYYPQVLQKVIHSSEFLTQILDKAKTDAEFSTILQQYAGITDLKPAELKLFHERSREQAYNAIISERAGLGWTTSGHTGVDVPLIAYGNIKTAFTGRTPNIQIAKNIAQYIGVDMDAASKKLQQTYLYPNYRMSIDAKVALSRKECAVLLGQNLDQFKTDFISVDELQKVIRQPIRWESATHRLIIGSEAKI